MDPSDEADKFLRDHKPGTLSSVIAERDAAMEKLDALERSIADLSHANILDMLAQRDSARTERAIIWRECQKVKGELAAALDALRLCRRALADAKPNP